MRRADIPIAFTSGYSPHMIMSFAQPLGLGVTSDAEYLDIELTRPISSEDAVPFERPTAKAKLPSVPFRSVEVPSSAAAKPVMVTVQFAPFRFMSASCLSIHAWTASSVLAVA